MADTIDEIFEAATKEAAAALRKKVDEDIIESILAMGTGPLKAKEAGPGSKYLVFDAEANGLLYEATRVHCLVFWDAYKSVWHLYWDDLTVSPPAGYWRSGDIKRGIAQLGEFARDGYKIVGHNITGYDLPLFFKLDLYAKRSLTYSRLDLFKADDDVSIEDTYINCCLLNPEQPPGLEYWGKKLGIHKPAIEDWSTLTTDMLTRCIEDVKINVALYGRQLKRLKKGSWREAQLLEMRINYIHSQQVLQGIRIDILKGKAILKHLDDEMFAVSHSIHERIPPTVIAGDEYKKPFLKSGGLQSYVRNYFKECDIFPFSSVHYPMEKGSELKHPEKAVRIGGPFSKVSFEPVNLNSHPRVKEILLELGWVPTEYNFKKDKKGAFVRDERGNLIETSPKLTEDSYDSLPPGLGADIAKYLMLAHRRRFILNENDPGKGLLSFVRPETGRAPADAFTCGTNTSRYRHKGALVNLPRPKTIYGSELRSLFTVPKGKIMVGIDLSGIEARVMAHYAFFYDKGAYLETVLDVATGKEKDVHQTNADILGVTRDTAKSFLYAISYGAGAKKLASVLGTSIPKAKALIKKYWDTHYGLRDLVMALEAEYARTGNSILGIDGRKLYIRGSHKLLNTLVQGAAAVIFKKWMVSCYLATRSDSNVNQILAYHDELGWEFDTTEHYNVEDFANNMLDHIVQTGLDMGLNVPLSGDAKIGVNYSEVH